MSVSTTIDSTSGVISTVDGGSGGGTVTIGGLKTPVTALTTAATLTAAQAGAFTFGGGAGGAIDYVMPLAASCPGSVFTFRSVTAYAHALTCSQETNGTLGFAGGSSNGSKVAVAAVVGSSVSLVSDGAKFLVLGNSGSLAFSGT